MLGFDYHVRWDRDGTLYAGTPLGYAYDTDLRTMCAVVMCMGALHSVPLDDLTVHRGEAKLSRPPRR